jgi:hypothetical protein
MPADEVAKAVIENSPCLGMAPWIGNAGLPCLPSSSYEFMIIIRMKMTSNQI